MATSPLIARFLARREEPRIAITDARGDHAYAEVVTDALRVASALDGASCAGRRVAVLVAPSARFVAALYGVWLADATAVILSPLHPVAETRYFCADADVAVVVVSEEHAALAAPLEHPVRPLEPWLAGAPKPTPNGVPEATHPALQLYTSGTTGKPKGAVLTHENLGVQQALVGDAWGVSERDVLLHALPLHHMHGLAIALLTALGAGARVHMTTFDATAIWEKMRDATIFMGVPAMYHRLLGAHAASDEATRARWSAHARALRLATSGSAALPVGLAEAWRAITGKIPLERFGMTEIGVGITNRLEGERFPGCVGFPLPTVETRIVGDEGEEATTGELLVRGPSVFAGYHLKEEETKKAFVADPGGGAPWFRTGDTVTRDATLAGAPFKILGRTSVDILKSGGYKLSALEIEEVLREHPSVSEVAVVGVPDEAWGDRVVACVVAREGMAVDGAGLRAFTKERLAAYKVPKDVLAFDALPKNALGKVVKPDLLRLATARLT